jgi:hypothetical protein
LKHTRKHERKERGIEPRSKAARHWQTVRPGGADGPHWPRGQSGQVPRTVRPGAADSPARSRGQSVKANRTTRDEPGKTDCPQGPGGPSAQDPDRSLLKLRPSANRLQQKPKTKPDQNKNTKNTRRTGLNWHLADGPRRRGRLSASSNRTEKPELAKSTPPTHHQKSQTVQVLETRFRGDVKHP